MIKHIVLWKLAEPDRKAENTAQMKKMLEGLVGIVPGLLKLEVNPNINPNGFDVCLYSEFEDKAALDGYQTHPAHLECKKFVHSVISDRTAADFETEQSK